MNRYKYRARDRLGIGFVGEVEAENLREAASLIRQRGWFVTKLTRVRHWRYDLCHKAYRHSPRQRDFVLLCRGISVLLRAGVPLLDTIGSMTKQAEDPIIRKALAEVFHHLQAGSGFAAALKLTGKVFPADMISLATAGEASGCLDTAFDRLADYLERRYQITEKVKSALFYPFLLLLVSMATLAFLIIFVLPVFAVLFENLHTVLPLPTQILLTAGRLAGDFRGTVFLLLGLVAGLGVFVFRQPQWQRRLDAWFLRLPLWGRFYRRAVSLRISSMLSLLLGGGIAVDDAVGLVQQSVTNSCFSAALKSAQQDLQRGYLLSRALAASGLFEPMFLQLLETGEMAGNLELMLEKISRFYEMMLAREAERLTAMLEPLLLLFMGSAIGFIVLSLALPLFDAVTAAY